MRKFTTLGLSVAALAASSWLVTAQAQPATPDTNAPPADTSTAAPADTSTPAPAKKMHKSHAKAPHKAATAGDAAVDDLNAKSLSAAKSGQAFAPPTTPTPDKAAAKTTKTGKATHHAKKKAAPKAADAPAADAPAADAPK